MITAAVICCNTIWLQLMLSAVIQYDYTAIKGPLWPGCGNGAKWAADWISWCQPHLRLWIFHVRCNLVFKWKSTNIDKISKAYYTLPNYFTCTLTYNEKVYSMGQYGTTWLFAGHGHLIRSVKLPSVLHVKGLFQVYRHIELAMRVFTRSKQKCIQDYQHPRGMHRLRTSRINQNPVNSFPVAMHEKV